MAFTAKTKTVTKVQRLNTRAVEEADFAALLNNDTTLKALNQAMVVLLGSVKAATIGGATGGIQAPPPVPCSKNRWFGTLTFDSIDKEHVNSKGKKDYPKEHQAAMTANAALFRDRVQAIVDYYSTQDDLINADTSFNRGGVAGAAIGKD